MASVMGIFWLAAHLLFCLLVSSFGITTVNAHANGARHLYNSWGKIPIVSSPISLGTLFDVIEDGPEGSRVPDELLQYRSPLTTSQTTEFKRKIDNGGLSPTDTETLCAIGGVLCGVDEITEDLDEAAAHSAKLTGGEKNETGDSFFKMQFFQVHQLADLELPSTAFPHDFHDSFGQFQNSAYLPRALAEALWGTKSYPESFESIRKNFQISEDSWMGGLLDENLQRCTDHFLQKSAVPGEIRGCATSLEDLTDFASTVFNMDPNSQPTTRAAIVMSHYHEGDREAGESFKVVNVEISSNETRLSLTCHVMNFPFRMNICHTIPSTRTYSLTFASTSIKNYTFQNMVNCHMNTTGFNPHHASFKFLGTTPGPHNEICHLADTGSFTIVQRDD